VIRRLVFVLILAVAARLAPAAGPLAAADDVEVGRQLDAIRDQLVALDIEAALTAVDAVLARPALSDGRRVEAYDLKAQAHAASDDLASVEKDYRAILELKADYAPAADVTSKKAMDRFVKLKAAMIGTLQLDLEPKDASIAIDDRPVATGADGRLPVVAGERRLGVQRKGYDPLETTAHVLASQETLLKLRMVPNARAIIVRTDIPGVVVTLDGAPAGVTAPGESQGPDTAASLSIDDVPIGEHEIGLAKPCYASESVQEIVRVDLADRTPTTLRVVAMRPSRTRVAVTGGTYDAELRVDGERVASLPLTSFPLCPGVRTVETVAAGRVVWSGTLAADASDLTLDLTPRPNAVLVGAAWPKSWDEAAAGWSLKARVEAPAGADLTTPTGWTGVTLPPDTDLAVGVLSGGVAGNARTVLYSPLLKEVEERFAPPPSARPAWRETTIGAALVDGEARSVLVAWVGPGGPAARAGLSSGDRLVAIGGQPSGSAAGARAAIARIGPSALSLEVADPAGAERRVIVTPEATPRVEPPSDEDACRAVRAAWAAVDVAAGGPDAAIALANLAALLERSGQPASALAVWRRVRAAGGGRLAARAAYALGAGLDAAGKRAEAIEAFGQARAEGLSNGDAALAAAASDRLADLGVASR